MRFLVQIEGVAVLVFGVGVSVAFFVVLERSANGLRGK